MAKYDPTIHHRRSIRLQGYDYTQEGAYFVTIVTQGRVALFGEVVDGEMRLNRYGEIIQKWWEDIPLHFSNVETGAFVVMPNHIHGIIIIVDDRRGTVPVPQGNTGLMSLGSRGTVLVPPGREIPQTGGETAQTGGETAPLRKPTLGLIVAYFKYQSTKEINAFEGGPVTKLWQRNYYEHIIRNQHDLEQTWLYIESNPTQWETDNENPQR